MKKIIGILAVGAIFGALLTWQEYQTGSSGTAERNQPGHGSRWVDYTAATEDGSEKVELSLEIKEQELSDAEQRKLLSDARAELDKIWLGNNPSPEQVTEPLYLPDSLMDGLVSVTYQFDSNTVAGSQGEIYPDEAAPDGTDVQMTAAFCYMDAEEIVPYYFCVVPGTRNGQEQWEKRVKDALLEAEESSREEEVLQLPAQVAGKNVSWQETREHTGIKLFGVCVLAAAGLWFGQKEQEKKNREQRKQRLNRQYPMMVDQFSLLMGAGMSPAGAWKHMVERYETDRSSHPAGAVEVYEEMAVTWHQMQRGVSQQQAWEEFGRRIGLIHYRRFGLLLTQNLSRGTAGLGKLLSQEAAEMFEERKRMAKKTGEEAGTKLLFPMMIMLVVVIVILIVPAFLNMS